MADPEELIPDDNPLRAPLLPEQVKLLEVIWEPVARAELFKAEPAWPMWDYVARSLYGEFPEITDAADVLRGLPSLPSTAWTGRDYGLVWRTESATIDPRPDEIVGLSIAGLRQLEINEKLNFRVSDELASIVANLARAESSLIAKPHDVVSRYALLSDYSQWLVGTSDKRFSIPDEVTGPILLREFARIVISPTNNEIYLSGHWLRPFTQVETADQYLDLASSTAVALERREIPESPLTLIQTLDYLAVVLAEAKVWPSTERLVNAPDLQSAAALGSEVVNSEQFHASMLAVYNIIDKLRVPSIPATVTGYDDRSRTLNCLDYWLKQYLKEPDAHAHITVALSIIRDAVSVRHLGAHQNRETRARAARSLKRLGLPEYISDWSHAWKSIRSILASAFDSIRVEVQANPRN